MIQKFDGRYGFLSNFYPCEIEHQGIAYPSVEHFYVAMKCNGPQYLNGVQYTPADFREMVSRIPHPGTVKKLGRKMSVRKDWDHKKLEFMELAVRKKFSDEKLLELLVGTADESLVEGNMWHDNFWGVCQCEKCNGIGKNNLGKILMQVRDDAMGLDRRSGLDKFFG